MKRFLGIGALVLALALMVPAAILAFSTTQDNRQGGNVSASESDGSTDSTSTEEDTDSKAWVGIYIMEVTERLAEKLDIDAEEGVAVVQVVEDGPADDAGIERGDIILTIAGSDISSVSDVRDAVGDAGVGDTLTFTIERDGSESTYDVTVGERTEAMKHRNSSMVRKSGVMGASGIGATIASLDAELAEKLDIEAEEGVVIVRVADGGPADDAGLEKGDVIVSVDGTVADTVSDVTGAVRGAEVGDTLTFVVDREGESSDLSLDVTVEEGYGLRGAGLNLRGLGSLRGVLSSDEDGPVNITVSKVTVKAVGEDSVTLTPTEDGNDDITANVTDSSIIVTDGEKADLSDLSVDDEGYAVVIDGDLKLLLIGSFDDIGRGQGRFGRFDGNHGDGDAARRFGRGFGGGTFTLPPGVSEGRGFPGPFDGFGGTLELPQLETTT